MKRYHLQSIEIGRLSAHLFFHHNKTTPTAPTSSTKGRIKNSHQGPFLTQEKPAAYTYQEYTYASKKSLCNAFRYLTILDTFFFRIRPQHTTNTKTEKVLLPYHYHGHHRNNAHHNAHHPHPVYSIYPHNPRHMHQRSDLHDPDSTPIHKNVTQGLQTSPSLWLFCASTSALTQHHSNLLSYIDDTDNIQHAESTNYNRAHTHSQ